MSNTGPVLWLSAFLDVPRARAAEAEAFWCAATGMTLSARRGERQEFATLLPAAGDAYLRVQHVDGDGGVHLDLHVQDIDATTKAAEKLGAKMTHSEPGLGVLGSPGGLPFCLVEHHGESKRPAPTAWPEGRSLVDQVCLDIPADSFESEAEFWSALTGWQRQRGARLEFEFLVRPRGMPFRILLQRLDESTGPVDAHLDFACDNRDAEAARHETLGARYVRRTPYWITQRDPAGRDYCVTRRQPDTGLLAR